MVATPFLVGFDISKDILPPNVAFKSTITNKGYLVIDTVSDNGTKCSNTASGSERIDTAGEIKCNDTVSGKNELERITEAEHIDHDIQAFRNVNGNVVKIVARLPSLYF